MDSGCIYQRAADAIRKLTDQRQNQGKLYPSSYLLIVILAGATSTTIEKGGVLEDIRGYRMMQINHESNNIDIEKEAINVA